MLETTAGPPTAPMPFSYPRRRLTSTVALASTWAVSVLLAACRQPTCGEPRPAATPSAIVSAAESAPTPSPSREAAAAQAQKARLADWNSALLPDASLWLQALVNSPFPAWPRLSQPLETDRLALAIGAPVFRAARAGTRSCSGSGPCRALLLPIKLHTQHGPELSLTLAREGHSGPFPWTPLHGCSKRLDASDALSTPWSCGPLYIAEDITDPAAPSAPALRVTNRDSAELPLRLDWRGTGSLETAPLISGEPGRYLTQIFLVFEDQDKHWVSASKPFELHLE